ncbi:MAG: hypothetical protein ABR583_10860 [Gaiellaceae bacterium]
MRRAAYGVVALATVVVVAAAGALVRDKGRADPEPVGWLDAERRHEQSEGTISFSPDEVRVDRVVSPG